MIKVLIVEDSRVAQEFLLHVLKSDPVLKVVGIVSDGADALEAVRETRPDVVTMDIHMPKMNGFDATRIIMENEPVPIVIVSASTGAKDVASTFRAMDAGALAVVLLPPGIGHPNHLAATKELIRMVKLMSEIKVVRRYPRIVKKESVTPKLPPAIPGVSGIQLIAIGTSTGGPPVLNTIFSLLPKDISVPFVVVQHISPGFAEGFAGWLSSASGFPFHIAEHGMQPLPGHGYVAPDGFHIGVAKGPRIVLSDHAPENGLRPSAAFLFRSAAQTLGPRAAGVILTGMGKDGAKELLEMKNAGAITIAQDKASSVVYGMPGEAVKLGAAAYILSPEEIAGVLADQVKKTNGVKG